MPDLFYRDIMFFKKDGGAEGDRTPDLLHAMQALFQLSYSPMRGRIITSYI
jgi:hypothetical protein